MASWQYAWLTDQPYTTIGFSHPQTGLAAELAGILGAGVFTAQSNEWSISLDRSRINLGYVSGLLGDRGWEMFAVETRLQPNAMTPSQLQTNWYFKKQGSREPSSTAMNTSSMGASASASPAAPAMAAAPVVESAPAAPAWQAPAAPAAPAAPTYDTSLGASSTSPTADTSTSWQSAPQAPVAPAAPAGPEQAPMSGNPTPPQGPQG